MDDLIHKYLNHLFVILSEAEKVREELDFFDFDVDEEGEILIPDESRKAVLSILTQVDSKEILEHAVEFRRTCTALAKALEEDF